MRTERFRWRFLCLAPLTVLLASGAWLGLDRESGIGAMLGLDSEVRAAESRVSDLVRERDLLLRRVRALRSDPKEIEREARETLGMARPGELIVRWVEPDPAPLN